MAQPVIWNLSRFFPFRFFPYSLPFFRSVIDQNGTWKTEKMGDSTPRPSGDSNRRGVQKGDVCLWYLLVVTGQRPANLLKATFEILPTGLLLFYKGRKADKGTRRRGLLYKFAWSLQPSTTLKLYMRDGVPKIGTATNCATCINSWLKGKGFGHLTSTSLRLRLDNVCRELLRVNRITEREYEDLMDHTMAVSDKHYCTNRPA